MSKELQPKALLFAITIVFIRLTGLQAQTVEDIDGNIYKTVTIGTQIWMAENLKTTKYRNGDLIGTTNPIDFNSIGESTPNYQWAYDINESNVQLYGRLYTWYAVTDSRNVCPEGWHIPSDDEWTTLTAYLGGESVAGGKLRETDTIHWITITPITGITNETGFTALPGGSRQYSGSFISMRYTGLWWSSTEGTYKRAYIRLLNCNSPAIYRAEYDKGYGYSVRCLKD
jgi:uncharacterized protein (TIGR02145 family)